MLRGSNSKQQTATDTTHSSGQYSSDTDSSDNPDNTSEGDNKNSGGASNESNSSNQDNTNPGGASTSRHDLPPARKWTAIHTPDLIIGDPDGF